MNFREPPRKGQPPIPRAFFFAAQPDAGAVEQLVELQASLQSLGQMPGKPVDVPRLHVTLCDLGGFADQVPPSLIPSACAAAATVKAASFTIRFDKVGATKGPTILRGEANAPLEAFRRGLQNALIMAGLRRFANIQFTAHLTLSYSHNALPEKPLPPLQWRARDFVLIESPQGESRHIELGRWALD